MPGSAPPPDPRRPTALDTALGGARRLMAMDDETWARHANPWSVWTRVLTPLPLLSASIWSRTWIGWWCLVPVAATLAWIWWNPRAFPPPRSTESWAARGVLAERAVIAEGDAVPANHRRAMATLTSISALGVLPLAWGLLAFDLWAVALGIVVVTGAKLWFVDRCIWAERDIRARRTP